jgi:hypothetical protein
MVGVGSFPDTQYVADEYTKEALSFGFTVIVIGTGVPAQPFKDGTTE